MGQSPREQTAARFAGAACRMPPGVGGDHQRVAVPELPIPGLVSGSCFTWQTRDKIHMLVHVREIRVLPTSDIPVHFELCAHMCTAHVHTYVLSFARIPPLLFDMLCSTSSAL